ncbi:MAG: 6-bladed beta-propeller [Gemmatimonadota bacterium]
MDIHRPFQGLGNHLGAALLISVLTTGCGQAPTGDPGIDEPLTLASSLELTLGGLGGQDWQAFGEVVRIAFDPQGRLIILDQSAARVHIVDPSGELIMSFGTRGEGPGELAFPLSIAATPSGEIVVYDASNRGFIRFDEQGEYLGNVPLDPSTGMPGQSVLSHPEGGVVSVPVGVVFRGSGLEDTEDAALPVYHWELNSGADDETPRAVTRAWRPSQEDLATPVQVSGGITLRAPPVVGFEPPVSLAVLSDGTLALVDSSAYRIRRIALDGSELEPLSRPLHPRPVTQQDREADLARRLERLETGQAPRMQITTRGPGGGSTTLDQEAVRSILRQQLEGMVFWTEVPVLRRIASDPQGRLWVERRGPSEDVPGATDIFSAQGEYMGTLPGDRSWIPDALSPDGRGAYITRDELDVVTIEIRRLELQEG